MQLRLEARLKELYDSRELSTGTEITMEGYPGKYIVEQLRGHRCGGCDRVQVVVRYVGQFGNAGVQSVSISKA